MSKMKIFGQFFALKSWGIHLNAGV